MSPQEPVRTKLRISFDLDEVLFVSPMTHKVEPPLPFPFCRIYRERLRLGTGPLINELQSRGFEVWVYTSSFRSRRYIDNLFRHYGIKFDDVINGERHVKEVQRDKSQLLPQKLPNHYGISLHIDDEPVIAAYGKQFGFEVFQMEEQDDEWAEKILDRCEQIRRKKEKHRTGN